MVIALTPNATREWTPSSDASLPPEQRTVFLLRAIPFWLRAHLNAVLGMQSTSAAPEAFGRMANTLIRASLVGWRNFRDSAGVDVPFVTETMRFGSEELKGAPDAATYDRLEALDVSGTAELMQACMAGLGLNREAVLG